MTRLHSTGGPVGPPADRTRTTSRGPEADTVRYGPGIPGEDSLKLLGHLEGRRVLELGCSPGAAVTMARAGAKVIVVDESEGALTAAREAAAQAEVRIETRQGPLAELAFVRADTIDAAVSIYGLVTVEDIDRVFRQVHRVLRPERPLVMSLPHPAYLLLGGAAPSADQEELRPRRRWWDDRPVTGTTGPASGPGRPAGPPGAPSRPRTLSSLFTSFGRANYRVDVVAEPPADRNLMPSEHWHDALDWVPPTLILRARKQGL